MVFSSATFLFLFLPLLLLLTFINGNIRHRNGVLLLSSLLFYAWGEPVWILGMVGVTAVNYFLALLISYRKKPAVRKRLLAAAVAASLALLLYFKYSAFFVNSLASLVGWAYRMPEQHLPIVISFYTFQILTYTVDVYRKKVPVQKNFGKVLLYVSCFPQLIAGPIVQYGDVAEALDSRVTLPSDFIKGMKRFVLGLGKKVLLANLCGEMLEATVLGGTGAAMSFGGAWLSAVLYSMQLYFDFSAYSDMAIGLGRVLGFRYKENFNYPYIASSITDFWRRWHISLSGFFRDYVYIPLGGNRRGKGRTVLNLCIVWVLTGLWHGASWNFAVWGLYYLALLLLEKYVFAGLLEKIPGFLRHFLSLCFIAAGWVIFYYTDFGAMRQHVLALLGLGYTAEGSLGFLKLFDSTALAALKKYTLFPLLAMVCCLPIVPWLKGLFSATPKSKKLGRVLGTVGLSALLVLSLLFLVGQSYNPFIYFRF